MIRLIILILAIPIGIAFLLGHSSKNRPLPRTNGRPRRRNSSETLKSSRRDIRSPLTRERLLLESRFNKYGELK